MRQLTSVALALGSTLVLAGVAVAACTSTPGRATTTRTSARTSVPNAGTVGGPDLTHCQAVAAANRPDGAEVLGLRDVWGSDNGGHATTVLDLRTCSDTARNTASFLCRLEFPWLTAADTATGLAALQAQRVTVARLVSPNGAEVTETLVEFAPDARRGMAALRSQAVACGGRPDGRGNQLAMWSAADGQPTWVVRTSGPIALAVTYTDSGLSRRQQQTVMDRAWAKAGRSCVLTSC